MRKILQVLIILPFLANAAEETKTGEDFFDAADGKHSVKVSMDEYIGRLYQENVLKDGQTEEEIRQAMQTVTAARIWRQLIGRKSEVGDLRLIVAGGS